MTRSATRNAHLPAMTVSHATSRPRRSRSASVVRMASSAGRRRRGDALDRMGRIVGRSSDRRGREPGCYPAPSSASMLPRRSATRDGWHAIWRHRRPTMDQKLALLAQRPALRRAERPRPRCHRPDLRRDRRAGRQGPRPARARRADEFYVIVDGHGAASSGTAQHLRDLGAGESFGELALIAKHPADGDRDLHHPVPAARPRRPRVRRVAPRPPGRSRRASCDRRRTAGRLELDRAH